MEQAAALIAAGCFEFYLDGTQRSEFRNTSVVMGSGPYALFTWRSFWGATQACAGYASDVAVLRNVNVKIGITTYARYGAYARPHSREVYAL
jgi:hypothetical protein